MYEVQPYKTHIYLLDTLLGLPQRVIQTSEALIILFIEQFFSNPTPSSTALQQQAHINISELNQQYLVHKMASIGVWSVLLRSPQQILGQNSQENQSFADMITSVIAPYYKFHSLTSILISISLIVYITLAINHPPFLEISSFTSESLILLPENLSHFQFYRLFTAPFVYQDVTSLAIGLVMIWSLGSYIQQILGWKMGFLLTGLSGLVGCCNKYTIPFLLLGSNFSLLIIKWSDPNLSIFYRKITIVIYVVFAGTFLMLFINYSDPIRYNFYSSSIFGFLLTSCLGKKKQTCISTFRKLFSTVSLITILAISFILLFNLVFNKKSFI